MTGTNFYRLYKGWEIYYPMGHDLLRDIDGRYAVYAVVSQPRSNTVERVVVPGCFALTFREAEQLSIQHAMRLVDERGPAGSSRTAPPRWKENRAG
jgi:hypothetical protein